MYSKLHAEHFGNRPNEKPFEVRLEIHGKTALLRLSGEFGPASKRELEEQLLEAAAADPDEIILDLCDVKFIAPSGLRFLLEVWNVSRGGGFDFVVLPAAGPIRLLFKRTKLDQMLPVIEEVELGDSLILLGRNATPKPSVSDRE
jgi:anti-anti-sigma factor